MKQKKVVSMVCVLVLIISAVTLYSEEIRTSKYYGVHFITEIKENNVNVREAPSLEANVIVTLNEGHKIRITGISKVNEKIDGYSGYWFRIEILDFKAKELYPLGKWVFSKYVKDKDITPSIICLKKSNEILNNQVSSLELLIEKNGRTRTVKVPVERKKNRYTFVWNDYPNAEFMYYDVPGVYRWIPEFNEIRHVSYYSIDKWSSDEFTEDYRYCISDEGSAPGIRGVIVRNLKNGRIIFEGSYYSSWNLDGYEIDIVYSPSEWDIKNGQVDQETLKHFTDYQKSHKLKEFEYILVKYRYNFVEKKRKFIGYEIMFNNN